MVFRDPLSWLSIKYKLTLTFAGICLIGFGIGGYIISDSARSALEEEIIHRLRAQSFVIARSLDGTLDLLARRTEDFASDGYIRNVAEEIITSYGRDDDSTVRLNLNNALVEHLTRNKLPLVHPFQELLIFDVSGRLLASTGSGSILSEYQDLIHAFESDSIWYGNISTGTDPEYFPALAVTTPLWDLRRSGKVGYLMTSINIGRWIRASMNFSRVREAGEGIIPERFTLVDQLGRGIDVHVDTAQTAQGTGDGLLHQRVHLHPLAALQSPFHERLHTGRLHGAEGIDVFRYGFVVPRNNWYVNVDVDAVRAMLPVTGMQSRFLATGLIIALVTMIILFFPIRFLIRPLTQMREAAKKISEGKFTTRVHIESSDEIGDLGRSMNLMTEAIEERTSRLEQTAALLEKRSQELRLERDLLDSVVHAMNDGLIYLDGSGNLILHNAAAGPVARVLFPLPAESQPRNCTKDTRGGGQCLHCLLNPQESSGPCIIESGERVYEVLPTRLASSQGAEGKILVSRDVTERMRIDERQAHQERLAVLGEVSAMMAHELNNPLAAISMYNQMMETEFSSESPYREHIEIIRRNTEICKRTIRGLLDYASATTPEISEIDLHQLVSDVVRFLRPVYQRSRIRFDLQHDLANPIIHSDELYLRQVFVNLLLNAVQAIGEQGGTVTVRTMQAESSDDINIDVLDDGPGIPSEHWERIFDTFFTSKKEGKGTGLGLPTSRRIVESLGGSLLLVQSLPGSTLFRVSLPREAQRGTWMPTFE